MRQLCFIKSFQIGISPFLLYFFWYTMLWKELRCMNYVTFVWFAYAVWTSIVYICCVYYHYHCASKLLFQPSTFDHGVWYWLKCRCFVVMYISVKVWDFNLVPIQLLHNQPVNPTVPYFHYTWKCYEPSRVTLHWLRVLFYPIVSLIDAG